jgi:hypothetical protein
MPDLYGFTTGIAVCAAIYGIRVAYLKFKEIADSMKEAAALSQKVNELSIELIKKIDIFEKAASDNDKAANSIAKSAVQMQDMLVEIKAIMMPDPPDQEQVSIPQLQGSFLSIQNELLAQGLDPETAKWKAADYELEKIANGDLSEISMSL